FGGFAVAGPRRHLNGVRGLEGHRRDEALAVVLVLVADLAVEFSPFVALVQFLGRPCERLRRDLDGRVLFLFAPGDCDVYFTSHEAPPSYCKPPEARLWF